MEKKKSLEWRNCSEENLFSEIADWVKEYCGPGTLLFLEGEMGSGKSTFARAVIRHLAKDTLSHGSPTFPLVHEYRSDQGFPIYHIDLYRLKSEEELELSGIAEQIDSRDALVLIEWGSMFSGFFSSYSHARSGKRVYGIEISVQGEKRDYKIRRP